MCAGKKIVQLCLFEWEPKLKMTAIHRSETLGVPRQFIWITKLSLFQKNTVSSPARVTHRFMASWLGAAPARELLLHFQTVAGARCCCASPALRHCCCLPRPEQQLPRPWLMHRLWIFVSLLCCWVYTPQFASVNEALPPLQVFCFKVLEWNKAKQLWLHGAEHSSLVFALGNSKIWLSL